MNLFWYFYMWWEGSRELESALIYLLWTTRPLDRRRWLLLSKQKSEATPPSVSNCPPKHLPVCPPITPLTPPSLPQRARHCARIHPDPLLLWGWDGRKVYEVSNNQGSMLSIFTQSPRFLYFWEAISQYWSSLVAILQHRNFETKKAGNTHHPRQPQSHI